LECPPPVVKDYDESDTRMASLGMAITKEEGNDEEEEDTGH
jgi:hypothetical protein